jgi:predicted GIY-YIG superfamily endonuclease
METEKKFPVVVCMISVGFRCKLWPCLQRNLATVPISARDSTKYNESRLKTLSRASASALLPKLVPWNQLGFAGVSEANLTKSRKLDASKMKIADLACHWKSLHPDKVILVRIGDFYEAWGIDAIMLVEHAGLNPMGDSCRAGCPKGNIQQTLNSLTEAGLSVAVYEEVNVAGSRSKRVKKERYLSQVVTPGRPVYLHDACLTEGEIPYRPSRPYGAIRCTKNGCRLGILWVDSREIRIADNITEEAVGSLIDSVGGLAEPVWLSLDGTTGSKFQSFLPGRVNRLPASLSFDSFLTAVKSDLARELSLDSHYFSTVEHSVESQYDSMRPLHSTAAQFLGLIQSAGCADLIRHSLPINAPYHSIFFLRQWLLSPPPRPVSDSMVRLVTSVKDLTESVPQFRVVPVDKLVRLLESRNGNFNFFTDLYMSCNAFLRTPSSLLSSPDLLQVVTHCAGTPTVSIDTLISRGETLMRRIAKSLNVGGVPQAVETGGVESFSKFITCKESEFVGLVRGDYASLNLARMRLVDAVERSLINPDKSLRYDQVSDVMYVKEIDTSLRPEARKRPVPDDSTRKRHTTDLILRAENEYREAVSRARETARREIEKLCEEISTQRNLLEALIFFSHWAVVLSTVCLHVEASLRRGWTVPALGDDQCTRLESVWPYWLELNSPAVPNSVTLTGGHTAILTAPNMSGKSTLIRSIAAALLLGNCGLMVPARHAVIHKISDLLVVSPSGDRPSENLSAFAAEADAMSSAIRHSSSDRNVLLLVDEFGRGTSGNDASALSAAVIKFLAGRQNVSCIWATHLHELFAVPGLGVSWIQIDGFRLIEGQCIDSKGIEIASERGFPDGIIREALAHRGRESSQPVVGRSVESIMDEALPSIGGQQFITLPPGSVLPPSVQASAIVYILRLNDESYYIGETENFRQRLETHRRRFGEKVTQVWVAVQPDRSSARALETTLIRMFMRECVPLVSIKDGFHQNITRQLDVAFVT